MYIDSHCHLDFPCFDDDRPELIKNCLAKGVQCLLIPGVAPDQWAKVARLCQQNPSLYFSVGLHPCWAESVDVSHLQSIEASLRKYTASDNCIGIGECGLDATIETPLEHQQVVFEWHLKLAEELDLPLIIHCVKRHNQVLSSLSKFKSLRGVIHAYSGSYEMALQYWQKGFYLGAGGTITYERAKKTRKAFSKLPIDAILLETDAPDMPIAGHQGQRNSPEHIPAIAQTLAELQNCPLEQIAQASSDNFNALFHL